MCDTCRKIDPTFANPLEDADETPTPRGPQEKTLSERILEAVDTDWQERHVRKLLEKRKSITVGTQVRLTGVVRQVQPNGAIGVDVYVGCQNGLHWFRPEEVEVIRQPFKRGEVVHLRGSTVLEPAMVLEDESDGRIIYISLLNVEGQYPHKALASDFERRP